MSIQHTSRFARGGNKSWLRRRPVEWLLLGVSTCGCGGGDVRPAAPAAHSQPTAAVPSASAPVTPQPSNSAPTPSKPTISLTARPKATSDASLEIRFPVSEQLVPLRKASGYRVRLTLRGAAKNTLVWLQLDRNRPRSVAPTRLIALSSLVDADTELERGPHQLASWLTDSDGVSYAPRADSSLPPFAAVRFHIGRRDAQEAPTPQLRLLQPRGTVNGELAAKSVFVDWLAWLAKSRANVSRVELTVTGPGGPVTEAVDPRSAYRLGGLQSGDYRVAARLLDTQGTALPGVADERTVTVNLDAPVDDQ